MVGYVMVRQLTDLNWKLRELIKMMPFLLSGREVSPFVLHTTAMTHSGPSQAPKMNLFKSSFRLTLLTIFAKSFIIEV